MATTEVRISLQGDVFVPSVSSVSMVAGDSVTFFGDPDTQTNLCMTNETASVFAPKPGLMVTILPGDSKTFQFSAATPGNYCILAQASDWPYPDTIDCGSGGNRAVLSISPGKPPNYSGPEDDTKT